MNKKFGCAQRYRSILKAGVFAAWTVAVTFFLSACNSSSSQSTSGATSAVFRADQSLSSFSYSSVGDPDAPVTVPRSHATASFVLMGGGPDVDPAFRWLITRAGIRPGTGGHFVVLKATPSEMYGPYIYYSDESLSTSEAIADQWVGGAALGLSSVETLIIPDSDAANDEKVSAIVSRADAVFIGGGDQSNYIKYWKGTRLDSTFISLTLP